MYVYLVFFTYICVQIYEIKRKVQLVRFIKNDKS